MFWLLDTVSRFDSVELFDKFLGVFGVIGVESLEFASHWSLQVSFH